MLRLFVAKYRSSLRVIRASLSKQCYPTGKRQNQDISPERWDTSRKSSGCRVKWNFRHRSKKKKKKNPLAWLSLYRRVSSPFFSTGERKRQGRASYRINFLDKRARVLIFHSFSEFTRTGISNQQTYFGKRCFLHRP